MRYFGKGFSGPAVRPDAAQRTAGLKPAPLQAVPPESSPAVVVAALPHGMNLIASIAQAPLCTSPFSDGLDMLAGWLADVERASRRIISDAFSAIITTGAWVFPDTSVGIIEQSTTRRPDTP